MCKIKLFCVIVSLLALLSCGLFDGKYNVKLSSIEIIAIDSTKRNLDIYPTISANPSQYWSGKKSHYVDTCHWVFDSSNAGLPDTISRIVGKLNVYEIYPQGDVFKMTSIDFNPDLTKRNQFIEDSSKQFKIKIDFEIIE